MIQATWHKEKDLSRGLTLTRNRVAKQSRGGRRSRRRGCLGFGQNKLTNSCNNKTHGQKLKTRGRNLNVTWSKNLHTWPILECHMVENSRHVEGI